jgi:hypothetical protein
MSSSYEHIKRSEELLAAVEQLVVLIEENGITKQGLGLASIMVAAAGVHAQLAGVMPE